VVIVTVRPVFANVKMDGLAALVQDTMANLELQDIVLLGLLLNAQFVRTRQLNVVDLLVVIVTRPLVNVNARILGLVVPAVLVTENQEHLVTALLLPPLLPLLLKTMLCARFAHTKKRSVVVLLEEPATEILVLVNVKMDGLVVLVQDVMANQEPMDTVFLALPVALNAQFAHTREKNVVGLLVELVTLKQVNVLAKHPTLVEPAVTVLVMLVLLVTTYPNLNLNL